MRQAKIAAVGPENLINRERELLIEAKSLMPRLPLDEIDVLFIKRIGKNISGAGMDTNIVGRNVYGFVPGESWRPEMPSIFRIVVSELAEESNGNAIGMGLADFGTERLREQVDFYPSYLNAVTGFSRARLPPAGNPRRRPRGLGDCHCHQQAPPTGTICCGHSRHSRTHIDLCLGSLSGDHRGCSRRGDCRGTTVTSL